MRHVITKFLKAGQRLPFRDQRRGRRGGRPIRPTKALATAATTTATTLNKITPHLARRPVSSAYESEKTRMGLLIRCEIGTRFAAAASGGSDRFLKNNKKTKNKICQVSIYQRKLSGVDKSKPEIITGRHSQMSAVSINICSSRSSSSLCR